MIPSVETAPRAFDITCDTLIVGAGACGLVAALAAADAGRAPLVIEADPVPRGSTALSAGLIPAAGTRLQAAAGVEDSPALFARDIMAKARGQNDPAVVDALSRHAAPVIEWLADRHGLPFSVVEDFDYPGHSRRRMHGLPTRAGTELIDALRTAVEREGIDIICNRRAVTLSLDGDTIRGVTVLRGGGGTESIGCTRLILACNGFGGHRALVARHMPEIADALWFGHDGNKGEAVIWGDALGAALDQMGAFQGHGNVAFPEGILITWAVITAGGIQVNREGLRFWDESRGYSEAARVVLAQPDGIAFAIFDARIAEIARQFEDFKRAETAGAIKEGETPAALAAALGLPAATLAQTIADCPWGGTDGFGRTFGDEALRPPYLGVRVTGALFHTQGGLKTDGDGRVLKATGGPFPNLFAGGGAAAGVSGPADDGYLSGNGLLSAVVLGARAARAES
ncbi:MAG: FAD-dependent oxidoreductase [Pseudomonadota bacterium]